MMKDPNFRALVTELPFKEAEFRSIAGAVLAGTLTPDKSGRVVLPPNVVARLGLAVRGQRVTEDADGRRDVVGVTEPLIVELEGRDTLDEALVLGDEVLIGQTVLEKLDLFVDCQRRRLIPNPAHPDQPVTKVK